MVHVLYLSDIALCDVSNLAVCVCLIWQEINFFTNGAP